jgi:hypothetical protein
VCLRLAAQNQTQNRGRTTSAPSAKSQAGNLPNRAYNQQLGGVSGAGPSFHFCEVFRSGSQTPSSQQFAGPLVDGIAFGVAPMFRRRCVSRSLSVSNTCRSARQAEPGSSPSGSQFSASLVVSLNWLTASHAWQPERYKVRNWLDYTPSTFGLHVRPGPPTWPQQTLARLEPLSLRLGWSSWRRQEQGRLITVGARIETDPTRNESLCGSHPSHTLTFGSPKPPSQVSDPEAGEARSVP